MNADMKPAKEESFSSYVWKNKQTGLYLSQRVNHTHTGEHVSITDVESINDASVILMPHYSVRSEYERLKVDVFRATTISISQ